MADLNAILEALEPERIAEVIDIPQDDARESYQSDIVTIEDFEEFKRESVRFFRYQHSAIYNSAGNVVMPDFMAEGFTLEIIESAFSSVGGLEGAYHIARTGATFRDGRGGLPAIWDSLYLALKKESREQFIRHTFRTHVNPLEWSDRVELMRQYLNRFGNHISEENVKSPEELAANYEGLIRLHIDVMNSMRQHIRS